MNRGQHTLKVWMVDPGIVLDKILLETVGEVERSYLGPPESNYCGRSYFLRFEVIDGFL